MDQYYVVIGIFATLTSTARIVLGGVSFVDCWYVNEFSHFEAQIMMIYLIGETNVKKLIIVEKYTSQRKYLFKVPG